LAQPLAAALRAASGTINADTREGGNSFPANFNELDKAFDRQVANG